MYNLHRPDDLHTINIGMFDHIMSWIAGIVHGHRKTAVFAEISAGIPLYHDFCHCCQANRQIVQWHGEEMQYFSQMIYLALAAALHDPLPCDRVTIVRALSCVRSLHCWSLVVQYRTHATETLNHLVDNLEEFQSTMAVFTTYRTSKATYSISFGHIKDLKMQLKANHAIEDEERAECREARSCAQKEQRQPEDIKQLQDVHNSTVHERTSFNFVKINLMLHYEGSVQHIRHLVKENSDTQEINEPKMCIGPYRRSTCNFLYEQPILNDYLIIHVLWIWCLHLWQLAKTG